MRGARDKIKPRGHAGRNVGIPVQVRLTAQLDELIAERASRRGITHSAAHRELLVLGQAWDSIERSGLFVTRRALQFLGQGAASLTIAHALEDVHLDALADDGNDWGPNDRDRLKGGAVLMLTVEELEQLEGLEDV